MRLPRLGFLVIAVILGAAFMIEHGHRTRIAVPDASAGSGVVTIACLADVRDPRSLECRP